MAERVGCTTEGKSSFIFKGKKDLGEKGPENTVEVSRMRSCGGK